jgi:SAM-dependent methyltransferase
MTAQFDRYADTYRNEVEQAISFGGQGVDFYTQRKVEHLLERVRPVLGAPEGLTVLDVGCGLGLTDRLLIPRVKAVHGVDIAEGEIERARVNNPAGHYRTYDGTALPYEDRTFDLAFAVCVMHHVKPDGWPRFVAEMARVVRPGGLVAVYEHNPYNPLTRLAVSRCEFDQDAVLLSNRVARRLVRGAGLELLGSYYLLFFPFRARLLQRSESLLAWLPLGAQYAVIGRKRPAACPAPRPDNGGSPE